MTDTAKTPAKKAAPKAATALSAKDVKALKAPASMKTEQAARVGAGRGRRCSRVRRPVAEGRARPAPEDPRRRGGRPDVAGALQRARDDAPGVRDGGRRGQGPRRRAPDVVPRLPEGGRRRQGEGRQAVDPPPHPTRYDGPPHGGPFSFWPRTTLPEAERRPRRLRLGVDPRMARRLAPTSPPDTEAPDVRCRDGRGLVACFG